MKCPDEELIEVYCRNLLPGPVCAEFERHLLLGCRRCIAKAMHTQRYVNEMRQACASQQKPRTMTAGGAH